MHLLYVIAMYGTEYLAGIVHQELGHAFQKLGHDFSVFCLASAAEQGGRPADIVEAGIPVHRAVAAGHPVLDAVNRATQPFLKYNRFATGLTAYIPYLRRHPEIDLIFAEGAYPFGAMTALATRLAPKRFVVSVAGGDFIDSPETGYGYGRFPFARRMMGLAFRQAAGIRVTTPLVRDHVLRLGGEAGKIGEVPANVASYSFLSPGENEGEFRRRARLEIARRYKLDDAPLLMCTGRLLPIKGFDDAVRALAILRKEFPSARLLFAGPDRVTREGSYREVLQALGDGLGVGEALLFAGPVEHEEMKTHLAAADIMLVSSVLEGMNRSAVEAAAVGTPTVITRTAGIAELASEMGAGIMVEPRQPQEMAAAIGMLLSDGARRQAMAHAGATFARRFSSERIGAELAGFCEGVLRAGAPRPELA